MKFSVCNEFFEGWPIEKVFDYASQIGCDGVELAPFTLAESVVDISDSQRRKIRKAAQSAGVEIVGLHWLLVKPAGLYINHPVKEIRLKTQLYLKELIDFCADLGGAVLIHGSPNQRTVQKGWDSAESWKYARETFESCAEASGERGVIYCIEPLSRALTNFINTANEALLMVEEINHPNFQMMLDCRSSSTVEEVPFHKVVKRILSTGYLQHVHANDPNEKGPGFGDLKFTPILKTLIDEDYQGYVSVEVFDFKPDPQTIAGRSIGYLLGIREVLEQQRRQP